MKEGVFSVGGEEKWEERDEKIFNKVINSNKEYLRFMCYVIGYKRKDFKSSGTLRKAVGENAEKQREIKKKVQKIAT
jgi:hypothetical protein